MGAASSSDSSSSEDDADDVVSPIDITVDLRLLACVRACEICGVDLVGVRARPAKDSAVDGGRKEGTGESVGLFRD